MGANYKPLGTRVVIKEDSPEEKSTGGIIIPEIAKTRKNTGTVVIAGDKCHAVKPNDRILYPQDIGVPINIGGEDLILILEESIDIIL